MRNCLPIPLIAGFGRQWCFGDKMVGMRLRSAFVLIFAIWPALGQPNPARPEFEAAVVKRNTSGQGGAAVLSGTQYSVFNVPVRAALQEACDVPANAIIGAPAWFDSDRFDIVARKPADTSRAAARLMLQSLLTSEFQLVVHKEQRLSDVWALAVATDGPRLQKAAGEGKPACQLPDGAAYQHHLKCTNVTMSDLLEHLHEVPGSNVFDRPLVNLTGLTGAYDIQLDWVLRFDEDTGQPTGGHVFDALARQLGLVLAQRRIPQPAIVVDHAARPALQ